MVVYLLLVLLLAIAVEVIKGLSANGTPPYLQKFSWQMDLAHFMWSNIWGFRAILVAAVLFLAWQSSFNIFTGLFTLVLVGVWGYFHWLFTYKWLGRVKFPPLKKFVFAGAEDNTVDPVIEVLGVVHNGEKKAVPLPMINFHHQISDSVGGKAMWFTYCGLCRSGRVYDATVDGQALTFELIGAITYNATFKDKQTGSWWRQELGTAAKGPLKGKQLGDIEFEQMSVENWLTKHPDAQVLQFDPQYMRQYNFSQKLLSYEGSWPAWARQDAPPLIIGVEVGDEAKAYDFIELQKARILHDTVGGTPLVLVTDKTGQSSFAYDCRLDGQTFTFELTETGLKDAETGSDWDKFGRCTGGAMAGKELTKVKFSQQFVRSWISFHPNTEFYVF